MLKTIVGGLLVATLIVASGVSPDAVVAQAKKDDKAAKKEAKKDSKAGVIEIAKGKDDKFRFFVRDGEGKLLAMSGPGGFATPKEAQEAIDDLKEVVAKVSVKEKDDK